MILNRLLKLTLTSITTDIFQVLFGLHLTQWRKYNSNIAHSEALISSFKEELISQLIYLPHWTYKSSANPETKQQSTSKICGTPHFIKIKLLILLKW